jgi:lipid-A-disaccharide synthase-like uncharacterized protein
LGQAFSIFIYARNLVLIARERNRRRPQDQAGSTLG